MITLHSLGMIVSFPGIIQHETLKARSENMAMVEYNLRIYTAQPKMSLPAEIKKTTRRKTEVTAEVVT